MRAVQSHGAESVELDPEKIENSSIAVTIDANSASTGFAALDTHLKSSDFLHVEKFPEIRFQINVPFFRFA